MGRALRHLTATAENCSEIWQLIPHPLRLFLVFHGLVWAAACQVLLPEPLPLFIANIPVMQAVPCCLLFSTSPWKPRRPADPLADLKLDPRIPLPEEVVRVALQAFPDAIGFMVFFDYRFCAVYEKSVDLEDIVPLVPSRFGGHWVEVTHDSISFSSGDPTSTPVLHTSREFSSRVSVSREYFCLERSRSSRNASLHSSCLVCPECRPRIKSCGTERARAAVVLDSDFDGLRLSRRQLLKGRTHTRASGINRWYEQKTPYAAVI
jgi:hypothetical protein